MKKNLLNFITFFFSFISIILIANCSLDNKIITNTTLSNTITNPFIKNLQALQKPLYNVQSNHEISIDDSGNIKMFKDADPWKLEFTLDEFTAVYNAPDSTGDLFLVYIKEGHIWTSTRWDITLAVVHAVMDSPSNALISKRLIETIHRYKAPAYPERKMSRGIYTDDPSTDPEKIKEYTDRYKRYQTHILAMGANIHDIRDKHFEAYIPLKIDANFGCSITFEHPLIKNGRVDPLNPGTMDTWIIDAIINDNEFIYHEKDDLLSYYIGGFYNGTLYSTTLARGYIMKTKKELQNNTHLLALVHFTQAVYK